MTEPVWLKAYCEEELPPFPGGWKTYPYKIVGHDFPILAPAQPDALLDLPEVLEANRKDDYMPYWGFLWPTSLDMSKAILQSRKKPDGDVLELGTGVGLVGIAALRAGWPVIFTDYDETSVRLALLNAERNGFAEPRGCLLDWRAPFATEYKLILGCDLIYERQTHEPMLTVLQSMLAADGECWLADPGRHQADHFLKRAKEEGYKIEHQAIEREPFPSRPEGTTNLWILRK
ncbi:MAG: 50S ribosomal protein L11 methyltransferase [Planctomycetales bacterium]